MAEDPRPKPSEQSDDEPSLELPSLRSVFRRRRRTRNRSVSPSASRADVPRLPRPASRVTTPAPPRVRETPDPAEEPIAEEARPPEPPPRAPRRPVRVSVPGPVAAGLTGVLVGLGLVGLTSASLHLCRSWRGTASCGQPGLLLLLAITLAVAALGAALLRLLGVATGVSTSLLGVGLLVVLGLLGLVLGVGDGAMVVVVPVLALLTHLAAWWLTTTYDEPGERPR